MHFSGRAILVIVVAATGGVWKTTNAGIIWKPFFDDMPTQSIGDIAPVQSAIK